jgi:uncharacterized protein YijF (DUF1287 family)
MKTLFRFSAVILLAAMFATFPFNNIILPNGSSLSFEEYYKFDFNGNGISDQADFLSGAKKDAQNKPVYDDRYWENGYPPDNIGVCTDVIWRAFRVAGYSLRKMVDNDIHLRPDAYPNIIEPNNNIDFRRVVNLRVFFEEYAVSLTKDPAKTEEWQSGDIVIFCNRSGRPSHIAMVSDKRRDDGVSLIIHNGGQEEREEDYLYKMKIIGHYRFDASRINKDFLFAWDTEDDADMLN